MITLLAALPLVVILILMVGFRWSGSKAGIAGWLTALIIAAIGFKTGFNVLLWAQDQWFISCCKRLVYHLGSLVFFRVTEADGTLNATSTLLQQLTPSRVLQVLLLAWGFTSFLTGCRWIWRAGCSGRAHPGHNGFSSLCKPWLWLVWDTHGQSHLAPSVRSYEALISATGLAGIGYWTMDGSIS